MDWIQILDPSNPKHPIDIDLPDPSLSLLMLQPDTVLLAVGHGLANVNRYNGHTAAPYSVAAHSVALALWNVRGHFESAKCKDPHVGALYHTHAQEALAHLLHDAPEGLGLGDVCAPVKRLIASEALEQFERLATYAVMGAVCRLFDPRREGADAEQIKRDLARLFDRVKRADTRILLDEFGAFVRYSPRKRDTLAGVGPLGIPQGPLRALAGLSPRAQTLLFAGVGLALRVCALGSPDDHEPFIPLLAREIERVRHWRGIGTHADAALALILAESILTDESSPQDHEVPQPCSFAPYAFHLRAEPDAVERFAAALTDRAAGTEKGADRLASQALRYGFEWHVHAPHTDNSKHGWRVAIEDGQGAHVSFARKSSRWQPEGMTQDEALARIFGAKTPNHFAAMIARAHPLAYEQASVLRLARLLTDPVVQDGQDDEQRAAAIKARAEKIAQALHMFRCPYGVTVWPEELSHISTFGLLTGEKNGQPAPRAQGDVLLYFNTPSETWHALANPQAPHRAPAHVGAASPVELGALLLDAEWQISPVAFRLDD